MNTPSGGCEDVDGCAGASCGDNRECRDVTGWDPDHPMGYWCKFFPPPLDPPDEEVVVEGLAEEDFPDDLSSFFKMQHQAFIALYFLLAVRILIQVAAESRKNCFELNRHWITLFVVLGCLVRVAYIYTVDLFPISAHEEIRFFAYGLRASNEVLWFIGFTYLAFYWRELQLDGLKQKVLNVKERKAKMYITISGFTLLRFGRAFCECYELPKNVLLTTKCACTLYMICFFLYMRYWGNKLLERLRSMNKRTSMKSLEQAEGGKKKNAALHRFQYFLTWEAVTATIWLGELATTTLLKHYDVLTRGEGGALMVLLLKIVQRGTEWWMVALLAYLVCLKTASKNFTMNYRLPTITVPILCRGSGWCSNVREDLNEREFDRLLEEESREVSGSTRAFFRRALGLTSSFGSFYNTGGGRQQDATENSSISSRENSVQMVRAEVQQRRNSKREAANKRNSAITKPKQQEPKRKKDFGRVRAPSRRSSTTTMTTISESNGSGRNVEEGGGERNRGSSYFEGVNPMARGAGVTGKK